MIGVDFFCGAGGLTRGMLDAGVNVVLGVDIDDRCRESYVMNNSPAAFESLDIRDFDFDLVNSYIGEADNQELLFAGCAPCQPFSQQRKSGGRSSLGTLLGAFGKYVAHFRPGQVLIENVPGITRVLGNSTYKRFRKLLDDCEYNVVEKTVDAKKYGVPQNRRRFILIAMLDAKATFPNETHGPGLLPFETVEGAIRRFPRIVAGKRHPEIPNHVAASISEINMERLRYTHRNGGDRRYWPARLRLDCHKGDYSGHSDVYGRMFWKQPSPALTGRCHSISNGRYGHPSQNRAISLREAASLQTFDDDYVFFGSNKHIALQIGNAVPVRLAEIMARHIIAIRKSVVSRC